MTWRTSVSASELLAEGRRDIPRYPTSEKIESAIAAESPGVSPAQVEAAAKRLQEFMDSKSRYKPGKVSVVPGGVVALGKDTTNRAHAFLETFHRVAGGLKNPKDLEELLQETCKAYDTDSASDWVAKEEHVRKFIAEKGQHVSADTYTKLAVLRYEKPTVLPGQTVDPDSPAFQEDLDYAINASDPEESISTFVQKYFNAGPYVISYEEEGDVGTVMIRFLEGNKDPIRFPPKDLWKALLASGVPQKKKFVLFAPSVQTTLNEETGEVIIDLGKESRTYNLSPRSGSEMDREASVSLYTQSDGSIGINIPDSLDANPVVMDGVVYLPSARLFSDPARPSTPELDVFGSKNFSDIDQVLAADPLTAEFLQELLLRSRDTGDYKQLSDIVTRLADQAVQQIKTWSPSQKDQFVANIGKFASGAIGRLSEFQDAEILTGPQMRLAKKLADAIIKLRAERDSLVAQILERQWVPGSVTASDQSFTTQALEATEVELTRKEAEFREKFPGMDPESIRNTQDILRKDFEDIRLFRGDVIQDAHNTVYGRNEKFMLYVRDFVANNPATVLSILAKFSGEVGMVGTVEIMQALFSNVLEPARSEAGTSQ